jgi:prepilin-type N-terminal cleavage/methylation domain-containing protein
MNSTSERGFTLIELVVATVVILLLLILSLFVLRPDDYTDIRQNAKRRTAVASIVQAINKYVADNGQLPPDIPSHLTAISNAQGHYDLCQYVAPKYIRDIPLDPLVGVKTKNNNRELTHDVCTKPGVTYASGYGISKDKNGRVSVTAPLGGADNITIRVP